MTARQLRAFAADLGVEATNNELKSIRDRRLHVKLYALRQRLNEFEDVRVTASFLNILLCDLVVWLDSSEKDVEADRTGVQCLQAGQTHFGDAEKVRLTGSCETKAMCLRYSATLNSWIGCSSS